MSAVDQAREVPWKPKYNPWAIALVVTLAAFMEVLDTTIVNVALPHIAGSLSSTNDEATWVLTSYLVANGIVLTISGWLSVVIGRKRYFLICLATFTVCSFLCGIANSLSQLIVFRLLQGFFGGGLQPGQQSIILDTFPPEKRGAAFGVTAIATVVAPVLGPTLGGFITDTYNWRWIFFANLPVGLIAVFFVSILVEDPPWHAKTSRHVDYIGLSLITLGIGCLQVMLDRGEDLDWLGSPFIRIMAVLAILGILGAIGWLSIAKKPVVNLEVFKDKNFAMGSVCMAATGAVLYAGAVVTPLFTQSILGYNATWSGLILSPGGDRRHPAHPHYRPIDARYSNAFHRSGRFLCYGMCVRLLERARRQYRFQDPDHYALSADRGAGLSVRANQHHRLRDLAAGAKRRRDGAFHDVPQYRRLDWGFGRDRHDHRADTGPSILSRPMGEPFPSTFQ